MCVFMLLAGRTVKFIFYFVIKNLTINVRKTLGFASIAIINLIK